MIYYIVKRLSLTGKETGDAFGSYDFAKVKEFIGSEYPYKLVSERITLVGC